MLSRTTLIAFAALALTGCGKKKESASTEQAKPAETKPVAKPADPAKAAAFKPTCDKLLPKDLLAANFAGMTVRLNAQDTNHAECALQKDGKDAGMIVYDCDPSSPADPAAMTKEREAQGAEAKDVPNLGRAAFETGGRVYRVLDNDTPCRLTVMWNEAPTGNALDAVRAVVEATTDAVLK